MAINAWVLIAIKIALAGWAIALFVALQEDAQQAAPRPTAAVSSVGHLDPRQRPLAGPALAGRRRWDPADGTERGEERAAASA